MRLLTKKISYLSGEINVPGFFCLPENQTSCPAVLIFHGSDGFKPNHEAIARKLAKEGLAALALNWFGGESERSHWDTIQAEDILQAVSFLKQQPAVDSDRLGLIGFSRGGGLALIMGSMIRQTKAIVNYFGLTSWRRGMEEFRHLSLSPTNHLNFVNQIECPILSFHGDMDTVVPVEDTLYLDAICRRFGVDHQHIIYPGVNHSFIWPGDKHDIMAHRDSWDKTLKFLKQNLKRH
jgi:carboxymethylenebutenolidase